MRPARMWPNARPLLSPWLQSFGSAQRTQRHYPSFPVHGTIALDLAFISGAPLPPRTISQIPALIPLALLEAIRGLDTPVNDGLDVIDTDLASKRLGLSPTVAAQIQRYEERSERSERVPEDEALSVFRLVARRPDAALAFADAGRRSARAAVGTRGGLARGSRGVVGRRLARRAARTIARETLGVALEFPGELPAADATGALTVRACSDGAACEFLSAALAELLRLTVGFEGVMRHTSCQGRGESSCHWAGIEGEDYA